MSDPRKSGYSWIKGDFGGVAPIAVITGRGQKSGSFWLQRWTDAPFIWGLSVESIETGAHILKWAFGI
jgi:hypothetical protein